MIPGFAFTGADARPTYLALALIFLFLATGYDLLIKPEVTQLNSLKKVSASR